MSGADVPGRPEYVKCVRHEHAERTRFSWCGRTLYEFEFAFLGVDHAAENGRQKAWLVACPACVEAITTALRNGHEAPIAAL